MSDDDWVEVAMADDLLVVQMLLRLGQACPPTPGDKNAPKLQLDWSVRQRRSRHVPKKKGDKARASPTTPLSWSGGTSVSGGGGGGAAADGFEESSRSPSRKPVENTRSKVPVTSETTGNKRSRRKKTLPELKEEESLLLKEKRYLKNELATFRLKVEKERAENEILKRMKLDLLSNRATEATMALVVPNPAISDQCQQTQVSNGPKSVACNADEPTLPNNSSKLQEVGNREPSFLLPDLNVPFEDDLGSGVLHGLS
ncbi:hypothetical protein SLE2022_381080 [Rubroshorea leprosula]